MKRKKYIKKYSLTGKSENLTLPRIRNKSNFTRSHGATEITQSIESAIAKALENSKNLRENSVAPWLCVKKKTRF